MLNLYAGAIRRCHLTLLIGLSVDVRFGSKADICSANGMSALPPIADILEMDLWPKKESPFAASPVRRHAASDEVVTHPLFLVS